MRATPQPIRLINQQINPLPPLQHPLNILRHDPPHILNLALHIPNRIILPRLRGPVLHHQLLQPAVERRRAIRRQRSEVRLLRIVGGQEALFDLDEKAEGDAPAETAARDHEVGEAAGGRLGAGMVGRGVSDVVDEVLVVRVG